MGKYQKGILGGFNGTIGTVVGATWKGIDYMKSRNRKSGKARTQAQLEQQARFGLVTRFVSTMGKLLMFTFKDSAVKMTGINSAFAYNYEQGLVGAYPTFSLNYSKVLVSKGQLLNAGNPVATANGNGNLKFDWLDNSGAAMANADDRCIVVIHCPELNQTIYNTEAALRSAGTASIAVSNFAGKQVETWVSFASADGSQIATSIYTGSVTVS